jgi:hypothetical protein
MKIHAMACRANTPAKKKFVLKRLEKLWLENPEFRLGQLIANAYGDPYYVEDFDLIERLEIFYDIQKEKN